MSARSPIVSFGLFGFVAAAVAAVVFLVACGFFSRWEGVVTGAAANLDSARTPVWIYHEGDMTRVVWPTDAVRGHNLRLDPAGRVPVPLPDDLPVTRKSRFSLHFIMQGPDGLSQAYPTTSTSALTLAVLAFFLTLFGRNMIVAGSPFRIEPRPTTLPSPQTPAGQLAPPRRPRPKKGPPPPRKRSRRR